MNLENLNLHSFRMPKNLFELTNKEEKDIKIEILCIYISEVNRA